MCHFYEIALDLRKRSRYFCWRAQYFRQSLSFLSQRARQQKWHWRLSAAAQIQMKRTQKLENTTKNVHKILHTQRAPMCCIIHIAYCLVSHKQNTFLDGYCSTVQDLLDCFEVDLGFTKLYYSDRFVCFDLYSPSCSPLVLFRTACAVQDVLKRTRGEMYNVSRGVWMSQIIHECVVSHVIQSCHKQIHRTSMSHMKESLSL